MALKEIEKQGVKARCEGHSRARGNSVWSPELSADEEGSEHQQIAQTIATS
jgi:hypothetical protein